MTERSSTLNLIRQRLVPLAASQIDITDESHLHEGHAGAREGGHFKLFIISNEFMGKNSMARHRLVYGLLGDLRQAGIHAINLLAKTPDEV